MAVPRAQAIALVLAAGLATAPALVAATADEDDEVARTAKLSGKGTRSLASGDADGGGLALIVLTPDKRKVCWVVHVRRIARATSARLHRDREGLDDPIVLRLAPPPRPSSRGCSTVTRPLMTELLRKPGRFTVVVRNRAYPTGALRGRLRKGDQD